MTRSCFLRSALALSAARRSRRPSPSAVEMPMRKAGLWEMKMVREAARRRT